MSKTTLRKALKEGKLEKFIREHENDDPGDMDKLDKALKRPVSEKSKAAPKSSSQGTRDD